MSIFTNRMQREAKTIKVMIGIYCRHNHQLNVSDCPECNEIQNYALERLKYCPYQEGKTSCNNCPIHCYKPGIKDDVKRVMRYSGPRMVLRHPILTLFHFIDDRRREPTHTPQLEVVMEKSEEIKVQNAQSEPCEHLHTKQYIET